MFRTIAAILFYLGLATAALAQQSVVVPATMFSVPINISTATTTLIVTGASGKSIYVTQMNIEAAGTGNIQYIAGTGATCGTNTVNLTGTYAFTAQTGLSVGIGNGAIWPLPSGFSLCAVTSAAIGMQGSLSYAIF